MERRTGPLDPGPRGDRPASVVVIAAALLVAVALVKPWGSPPRLELPAPAARTVPSATPTPTPAPTPVTADSLVAPFCFQPSGWRVFAAERWSDRDVRSWRSAETFAAATGPGDPRIPVTPLASQWVMTLGYCAPVAGPERPGAATSVTVFRLLGDGDAEVLSLERVQPLLRASPLGAVYAPPPMAGSTAGPGSGWQDGTYVFRFGTSAADPSARWLGVRIQILPRPDRVNDMNPGSGPP
jgi:hypothetical protein